MTTEIALTDRALLKIKEHGSDFPRPFSRSIDLGDYEVEGVAHIMDPGIIGSKLEIGGEVYVKLENTSLACDIFAGEHCLGTLPFREGEILARLMTAGKRLKAHIVENKMEDLLPSLVVKITMEEF